MAQLVFSKTSSLQETYSLEKARTVIGRDDLCDIVVHDSSISRQHAAIIRDDEGYFIEDLNSKNGTLVSGAPVGARTELADGDIIFFGDVRSHFYVSHPPTGAKAFPNTESIFFRQTDISSELKKLHFIYDLAVSAGSFDDERKLIRQSLGIIAKQLDCESVYFGIYDRPLQKISTGYHRSPEGSSERFVPPDNVIMDVLKKEQGIIIKKTERAAVVENSSDESAWQELCVPIHFAGSIDSILYAASSRRQHPFNKEDMAFLSAFGALMVAIIHAMRAIVDLRKKNAQLLKKMKEPTLLGDSPAMKEILDQARRYSTKGDATVLIQGESGTGKELASRLIHRLSSRSEKPFLAVNCAAIPKEIMESELFGHVKGAFTSAVRDRRGLFEMAAGGTLFFDEIGEMPFELQSKLLRVLDSGEYRPVGSEKTIRSDVRIIAATNRDLGKMAEKGSFRSDLFYRLNVLNLEMPPLRNRRSDVRLLAEFFLDEIGSRVSTSVKELSPEAIIRLESHDWPGNVRELRNVIERALYYCDGPEIRPEHLSILESTETEMHVPDEIVSVTAPGSLEKKVEELERVLVIHALERHQGNKTKAALELGISRKTMREKIKKYDL